MNTFQFNQNPKERACGWRCLHYIIPENLTYEEFLLKFKYLCPVKRGITYAVITAILEYYSIKYTFTVPSEEGTYFIWSGNQKTWKSAGGHYFIYSNGIMFDSLKPEPYNLALKDLIIMLETSEYKESFTCLKVNL